MFERLPLVLKDLGDSYYLLNFDYQLHNFLYLGQYGATILIVQCQTLQ